LKTRALSVLPADARRWIYRLAGQRLGGFEARVRYGVIDWTGTEAYCEENPYYPVFWINLKGRQPGGIVEPGRQYECVRDRLIRELEAWRHPETGAAIVEKVHRREDIYAGPCTDQAPDVIAEWALHQGYSYAFKLSAKSRALGWIERVDPRNPESFQFYTSKSGSHRREGIFVARGPNISAGMAISGASLADLAPTILRVLGVAVPDDMDGSVLAEILPDRHGPIVAACAPDRNSRDRPQGNGTYSSEEEQKISERLRALGYVE
jgi:predicted AlkP superfamily phosphohydrolase/phosphomutase